MNQFKGSSNAHGDSASATGSAAKDPALLKRRELAKALSVSARSIDNWQREKKIPFIRISPRCVLFDLANVLSALKRFEIREAGRR